MLLKTLALTVSTTALLSICIVSCREEIPDNNPCLVDLKTCVVVKDEHEHLVADLSTCKCYSYKLTDKNTIQYEYEKDVMLSEMTSGFCFPHGQLEKVLQWAREEKKRCDSK